MSSTEKKLGCSSHSTEGCCGGKCGGSTDGDNDLSIPFTSTPYYLNKVKESAASPAFTLPLVSELPPLSMTFASFPSDPAEAPSPAPVSYLSPLNLEDLLQLKAKYAKTVKLISGNSETGIEQKFKYNKPYDLQVYLGNVPELATIEATPTHLLIGGNCPLSEVQHFCLAETKQGGSVEKAYANMLRWFASTQIRNTATLGGNLATASPISDMNPMLAASGAVLHLQSAAGSREVPVKEFFKGYRTTALQPDEVIVKVVVPKSRKFEYCEPFKQAKRREDDISIVCGGIRFALAVADEKWTVEEACISLGGMSFKTITNLPQTEEFLKGKEFSMATITEAMKLISADAPLPDNVPGGQAQYRRTLAASFLLKFFVQTSLNLAADVAASSDSSLPEPPLIDERDKSGADSFMSAKKPSMSGTQRYPTPKVTPGLESGADVPDKEPVSKASAAAGSAVGLSSAHASGRLHCNGQAQYTDDLALPLGGLHGVLICAEQAGCNMTGVDTAIAKAIPGVARVLLYEDLDAIGGSNKLGVILKDEEVFATSYIRHVGMVIGICVGETLEAAQQGAKAVKVAYDAPATEPIVSIEQAVAAKSFYDMTDHTILSGSIEEAFDPALHDDKLHVVEGTFKIGGQEHFYLETNSTLCCPSEDTLMVYSSTQAPTKTQNMCASAAGYPAHKVTCKAKRMGGGFGGKETRSVFVAAACAVAARVTGRAVKVNLERNTDMQTSGQRHAMMAHYKASAKFDADGKAKLQGLDVRLYSNGGCSLDLSGPVLDRALFHIDGSYKWQALKAHGTVCKTIQPPHTAFRGFGGPQGIVVAEQCVDALAVKMGVDSEKMRLDNLYKEGERTHFGMEIEPNTWNVTKAYNDLSNQADLPKLRKEIDEFNKVNRYTKRGLAIVPTKFGIAFTAKFMNQGGSLVHLYQDGTVLVSHGGTEMGQGLHTKVCQVAAHCFGISLDKVFCKETSTDIVANTQPTAASASTDMYGMSTHDACMQIQEKLKPIREKLGADATLADVAMAAHFERVDLSAHGFYTLKDERCGYLWDLPVPQDYSGPDNCFRGHPFNYFTQGCSFSMVEVDCLTGDHKVLRADVVMDLGSSINPTIDIGQIEGAYVQGMGWSTTEELIWGDEDHPWVKPAGKLFTQGPGFYKPPAFNDCPEEFNVTLMDGVANKFAVMSSKAVGEPPFFMGGGVFFAIKDAIRSARKDNGLDQKGDDWVLDLPATSERIRMGCGDKEIAGECGAIEDVGSFRCKGSY